MCVAGCFVCPLALAASCHGWHCAIGNRFCRRLVGTTCLSSIYNCICFQQLCLHHPLVQRYSTFCFLAKIDPTDSGNPALKPGNPPLPMGYGQGDFPIDSLNLWPWLSGANRSSPRTEIVLGKMTGGAMIVEGGWKIILGKQSPDFWYGPCECAQLLLFHLFRLRFTVRYSSTLISRSQAWFAGIADAPNCTDAGPNGEHPNNCNEGCLFNIDQDVGEHVNLRNAQPARFAALKAKLEGEVGAAPWADEVAHSLRHDLARSGTYDDAREIAAVEMAGANQACTAMETKWRGFFGPYDGMAPSPSPTPPPLPTPPHPPSPSPLPPSRDDCVWAAGVDYEVGKPNQLPTRDSTSREECCAICWAEPRCAVAVFSGAKAKGRCDSPPGRNCCWLKTEAELRRKGSDPGVMSCMPNRTAMAKMGEVIQKVQK